MSSDALIGGCRRPTVSTEDLLRQKSISHFTALDLQNKSLYSLLIAFTYHPFPEMSSESTTEIVGGIFAEVFKVEDGWAHFEENYANEEGECGKAQFNELLTFFFNSYVNSDDEDENVVKMM